MVNQPIDTVSRFDSGAYRSLPQTRSIEDPTTTPIPREQPPTKEVQYVPYLPDRQLQEAVNVALTLRRPLLLQGDPGSGKTSLAYAVAYSLGWPLEDIYIKSTSHAQDLLYTYDAVGRLYDAQLGAAGPPDPRHPQDLRFRNPQNYVQLGPLGRAIIRAGYGRPSVVLIDEIDKADLDFPNDLLRELDRREFVIAEVPGAPYTAGPDARTWPLVIVTNNEEKALPNAFLRRCIFHIITLPAEAAHVEAILQAHGIAAPALIKAATQVYLELLKIDGIAKKPGLSELLDWVRYHSQANTPSGNLHHVPTRGVLLKQQVDLERVQSHLDKRSLL